MTPAREDVAQIFLVLPRHRTDLAVVHELGEPDDPVQRRPKLVGHVRQKLALEPTRLLETPVLLLPCFFEPSAIRNVADRAGDQHPLFGFQRAQADLDRDLRAVLAESKELEACPHRPYARIREEPRPMAVVAPAEPLGHEDLDRASKQLLTLVAEEPFGLRVHEDDLPLAIDDHDGIGRRLEQSPELRLRALALADVPDRAHRDHPVVRLQGTQADFHRELHAIAPPPVQLQTRPHRSYPRIDEVSGAVTDVCPAESLRDQHLDRLAE